jgi:hypothetical protein
MEVQRSEPGPEEFLLVRNFIAAGLAARRTIVKTVTAQADGDLPLARRTIPFAGALFFDHFALHAAILIFCGGSHG